MTEFRRLSSLYERTCWVCYATEEDEPGIEWTSPCMCRGATKWVHQNCLQHWVDEKQRGASSVEVDCPQCQHTYRVVYPSASHMLLLYEYTNRAVTFCSPMILAGLTTSALYWLSFSYGVSSACLAMGREEFADLLSNPESSIAVLALPLLPWAVFTIKLMRPEIQMLRIWYRVISPTLAILLKKLPVLKSSLPEAEVAQRFAPAPVTPLPFLARCVLGTVALPPIAALIGWILSYALKTNNLKRTLIGGALYVLLSYSAKVYLEHCRGHVIRYRRGRP